MSLQGAIRAGRAFIEIFADDGALERGLRKVRTRLKSFSKGLAIGGGALTAAATAINAPLLAAVSSFANAGDELSAVSEITGVGVEKLSALRYAAEQADVPIESLQGSLVKMNNTLGEAITGNTAARKAFNQIGLSVAELKALKPEEAFKRIADRIAKIKDPAQRTKAAIDIFGRSAAELLPLMMTGAKGIDQAMTKAKELGIVMSEADAAQGKQYVQVWRDLMAALQGLRFAVGSALIGSFMSFWKWVTDIVVKVAEWIDANRGLVVMVSTIGTVLAVAGVVLLGLSVFAQAAAFAISGLLVAFTVLKAIALAAFAVFVSPITMIIAALTGLTAVVLWATGEWDGAIGWISDTWSGLKDTVLKTVGGIADAISAGRWDLAGEVAMAGLKLVILTGWEGIKGVVRSVQVAISKICLTAWAGLQTAWGELMFNMQTGFKTAWTFITNKLSELADAFDHYGSATNIEFELDLIMKQKAAGQITKEEFDKRRKALIHRQRATDQRLASHQAGRDQADQELKNDTIAGRAALDAQNAQRVKDLEEELAGLDTGQADADKEARDRLQAAKDRLTKATVNAAAAGEEDDITRKLRLAKAKKLGPIAGPEIELGAAATTAGSFNASAAQFFGGQPKQLDRIAIAAEKTAKNTDPKNQKTQLIHA